MKRILTNGTKIKTKYEQHTLVQKFPCQKLILGLRRTRYGVATASFGNAKVEKLDKDNDDKNNDTIDNDSPPVIYIAKYNRLIDTANLTALDVNKNEDSIDAVPSNSTEKESTEENKIDELEKEIVSTQTLTHSTNEAILKAVNETRSFEDLSKRLVSQPNCILTNQVPVKATSLRKKPFIIEEDWKEDHLEPRKLLNYYLMLSKSRLTALVAITSVAGYSMAPNIVFDPITMATGTIGVALFSASANTLNQILEVPYDSQMNRTKNRVLVKCLITPRHAMAFAISTAVAGGLTLGMFVNSTAMCLGIANLLLYVCVYTPMKRITTANTWVGSVVGALPPLIGYASATGGTLDYGAGILAAILFSWQFPHFNSLSWNLRPDYSKAGYRMMSVTNPELCKRVALRHSIACIGICSVAAPLLDVTSASFAVVSLPVNGVLTYLAYKFYQKSDSASSRKLFRYTLVHLPLLLTLLYISKKENSQKLDNLSGEDNTKEYILSQALNSKIS